MDKSLQKEFEDIYRNRNKIYSWSLNHYMPRLGIQNKEDVIQESFTKAWKALPDFRHESHMATWIGQIIIHTAITTKTQENAKGAKVTENIEDFMHLKSNDSNILDNEINKEELKFAINELNNVPPKVKEAVVLKIIYGFKTEEVATIMSISSKWVNCLVLEYKKKVQEKHS